MTTEDEMRSLIERYITAYNAFDVDGMLSAIHSDIDFQNISGGAITATASGIDEFRSLAEQSRSYFSSRRQTITNLAVDGQRASAEVEFEATLAVDLPDGPRAGELLRLTGRSEYEFRDGKMIRITDFS